MASWLPEIQKTKKHKPYFSKTVQNLCVQIVAAQKLCENCPANYLIISGATIFTQRLWTPRGTSWVVYRGRPETVPGASFLQTKSLSKPGHSFSRNPSPVALFLFFWNYFYSSLCILVLVSRLCSFFKLVTFIFILLISFTFLKLVKISSSF